MTVLACEPWFNCTVPWLAPRLIRRRDQQLSQWLLRDHGESSYINSRTSLSCSLSSFTFGSRVETELVTANLLSLQIYKIGNNELGSCSGCRENGMVG